MLPTVGVYQVRSPWREWRQAFIDASSLAGESLFKRGVTSWDGFDAALDHHNEAWPVYCLLVVILGSVQASLLTKLRLTLFAFSEVISH